ncbi:hypothetical protein [Alteromonas halophila]|uniref:Alanine acetyltransferase n=1 Tax=Alteromonas halophila TaxID=516698 RepID=A0A918JCS6_9ALTE|nr:hypothetical protein [Alteromonas halophila]GGW74151.1 hypothetical protein GCM10007391_02430 [Alteromonas halophila]
MVTRFQQAVLQEMGIPLWVPQDEVKPDDTAIAAPRTQASVPSQQATSQPATRSDNSSGHLAAIRQSLADKKPDNKTDKKPATSTTTDAPAAKLQALSEQAQSSAFMNDVRTAFAQTGRAMPAKVLVGETLGLTPDALTLPGEPGKLDAADKRRLWALIVEGHTA